MSPRKIALILSGCGYLDGTEVFETTYTMLALSKYTSLVPNGVESFAPNSNQRHVIDHLSGEEVKTSRNILEETNRITRGKTKDLNSLNPAEFAGLIIPGGFGVAKSLSSFALDGHKASINQQVDLAIQDFFEAKKPIGAICIAPALVALALRDKNIKLTIGNDEGTASELEKLGANHVITKVSDICTDFDNKIISTPAFMYDQANLCDIYKGIEKCIDQVLHFCH